MDKVEHLTNEIRALTEEEFSKLRAWFEEFAWEQWDRQLERDVAAGKLDALAQEALEDYRAGKTTPL